MNRESGLDWAAPGYAIGGIGPIAVAAALVPLRDHLQGANLALILVLAAAVGGRGAGVVAAVVSALSFDFFLTRPAIPTAAETKVWTVSPNTWVRWLIWLSGYAINLRARGYDVDLARSGEQALSLAAKRHPDAVVLDLGLPGIDGVEVISGLRGWSRVPIVVLSARDAEPAKVAALDAGADDYVTKPFGMDELLARLRAALRRAAPAEEHAVVETDDFLIDLSAKRVRRGDDDVRLTPTEWHLVEVLVRNEGKLVTQRQLLEEVWGPMHERDTNYLRVFMAQVRRKLEPEPSRPRYFLTEAGMGYRFEPGARSTATT